MPSRPRYLSSTGTRNSEDEPSRDSVLRTFDNSILSRSAYPHRPMTTQQQSIDCREITKQFRTSSYHYSSRANVRNALPQALHVNDRSRRDHYSHRYHPMTRFSGSLLPLVSRNIARGLSAQEIDSMVADSPRTPTYATVFNVEEYRDSFVVSPALSPTHGITEPN